MPKWFRCAVNWMLTFAVAGTTPVPVFARSQAPEPDFELARLRTAVPAVDDFARARIDSSLSGIWSVAELDLDPYFMRSQTFVAPLARTNGEDTAYEVGRDGLTLQIPGVPRALRISRPLRPLFEFDRYLFFTPTDGSLFAGLLSGTDESQGVFFLDKKYVYDEFERAGERRPVPIFFLPLAGAWSGPVTHVFDQSTGTLALNNGAGHSATLTRDTLDHYAKLQALNLRIVTLTKLRQDRGAYAELARAVEGLEGGGDVALEFPFALPPRGSTFAFGAFPTGLDLDEPEAGLARPKSTFALSLDLLPVAHADGTTDTFGSLLKVMIVIAATWTTSTLAQFTVLRPRLLERRAHIERLRPPKNPDSRGYKLGREVKENIDILAHAASVLGNGVQTTGTYLLEYVKDRSGSRAAQSGWIRRGFEGTFGYIRRYYEWMATSAWVAFLGIFVEGSVDVAGHTLALFYASPVVLPFFAGLISNARRDRAAAEFAGGDALGDNLLWSEAKYQAAMTVVQAPYAKSAEQRRSLMEIVKPDIARRFRHDKINPVDPKNFDAIDDAVDERVEQMMVERGYPSRPEFLFSSPSLVRAFAAKLGYRTKGHGEHAFVFTQARWGVIPSVLRDAHRAQAALAERFPDNLALARSVLDIEEVSRRFHVLGAIAKTPSRWKTLLDQGRSVRELLTLWSVKTERSDGKAPFLEDWRPPDRAPFERLVVLRDRVRAELKAGGKSPSHKTVNRVLRGRAARESKGLAEALDECTWRHQTLEARLAEIDEETNTGLLGAAWRDPEAANLTGRAISQALASRLSGNSLHLVASEKDIVEFGADARAEALGKLEREAPGLGFDASDLALETLEIVKARALERDRERASRAWAPERGDWLARHQIASAHAVAERAIGYDLESDDARVQRKYREAYRLALSRKVGLRTFEDPSAGPEFEVMNLARSAAEDDLTRNFAENENWKTYLADKNQSEKLRFAAHHYADSFLSAYTEATVSNTAFVRAISPAQPGFFQRLRQTEFARRDNWLGKTTTYALRVGDSFFDATANKPGLANWINRRVPFAQDLIADTKVRFRGLPTYVLFSWSLNWYLWGVHFNLPTALLFWFTAGLNSTVHWWSDRVLVNVGVPPLQGFWSQFVHSLLMLSFGYFTTVPFLLFAEDVERGFDRGLANCQDWLSKAITR